MSPRLIHSLDFSCWSLLGLASHSSFGRASFPSTRESTKLTFRKHLHTWHLQIESLNAVNIIQPFYPFMPWSWCSSKVLDGARRNIDWSFRYWTCIHCHKIASAYTRLFSMVAIFPKFITVLNLKQLNQISSWLTIVDKAETSSATSRSSPFSSNSTIPSTRQRLQHLAGSLATIVLPVPSLSPKTLFTWPCRESKAFNNTLPLFQHSTALPQPLYPRRFESLANLVYTSKGDKEALGTHWHNVPWSTGY